MSFLDLKTVKLEEFMKHLNTEFQMHIDEDSTLPLKLIETENKSNEAIDGFSLIFLGETQTVFPQKIYNLSHNSMGHMSLFLVPVNRNNQGVYYQSIFSRLKNN